MQNFLKQERLAPTKAEATARINHFGEIYTVFDAAKAAGQAERCVQCGDAYCAANGCPLHNHIPYLLKAIAENNPQMAFRLSNENSPFPEILGRICPQDKLCEGACTLGKDGYGAVSIGAIETAITDLAFENNEQFVFAKPNGKTVAIVGSGPASLSAATFLLRHGIAVEMFEKDNKAGGLLTFGIPNFKLDKAIVQRRFEILQKAGLKLHLGVTVGVDASFDELTRQFDAVFVGAGARNPQKARVENENASNVYSAIDYLTAIQQARFGAQADERFAVQGKRVVVIGGGDTAMDCVRSSIRLGAESAVCVYRRGEESMPGSKKEFVNAKEEGAEFVFSSAPQKIVVKNGAAIGIECAKTHSEGGRGKLTIDTKDTHLIAADIVILALGFEHQERGFLAQSGVKLAENGAIIVNANGQTSNPKVYAGGDAVRGASLAVLAATDGKKAALAIAKALIG